MRNLAGISKNAPIYLLARDGSSFVGWQMLRFLDPEFIPNHKKYIQGKKDAITG